MSSASSARVALLCGSGRYPVLAAAELLRQGIELVAVAPFGETDPELRSTRVRLREFPFFRLARLLEILREEGAARAVMMGKLHKVRIYGRFELDDLALSIYRRLPDRRDVVEIRPRIHLGHAGGRRLARQDRGAARRPTLAD